MKYWKTREGKRINVKDLSDIHLKNILSYLIGQTITLTKSGYQQYRKSAYVMYLPDIFFDIEDEGKRRLHGKEKAKVQRHNSKKNVS